MVDVAVTCQMRDEFLSIGCADRPLLDGFQGVSSNLCRVVPRFSRELRETYGG